MFTIGKTIYQMRYSLFEITIILAKYNIYLSPDMLCRDLIAWCDEDGVIPKKWLATVRRQKY